MDRQQEAIIVSKNELNIQFASETEHEADLDIQVIPLKTAKGLGADTEW